MWALGHSLHSSSLYLASTIKPFAIPFFIVGQSKVLTRYIPIRNPRTLSLKNIPTAVFSIPPLATVGLTEEEAAARGETEIYLDSFTPMRHKLTGRTRRTLLKLVVDKATQQLLGAHMMGDDAPEIIQGISVAVVNGLTKQQLDRTVGIHPTAAEEFVTMRTLTRTVGKPQDAKL